MQMIISPRKTPRNRKNNSYILTISDIFSWFLHSNKSYFWSYYHLCLKKKCFLKINLNTPTFTIFFWCIQTSSQTCIHLKKMTFLFQMVDSNHKKINGKSLTNIGKKNSDLDYTLSKRSWSKHVKRETIKLGFLCGFMYSSNLLGKSFEGFISITQE